MVKRATSTRSPRTKKRKPQARARQWKTRFLKILRDCGNVREACDAVKIQRSTAYKAKDSDPEFAQRWNECIDDATDLLEGEARRRAYEGWEEPVFYQGVVCGGVRRHSDGLLTLLLKAHRPDKFRERIEHTGRDGMPLGTGTVTVYIPDNGRDTDPAAAGTPNPVPGG